MDQFNNFFSGLPASYQGPISAAVILIITIFAAYILRAIIGGAINRTPFGAKAKTTGGNIGKSIGKAVFWLTVLYGLYLALGRLNMTEQLRPIEDLFRDISNVVPKLIGAGFTLFIGYIVAMVGKNATTATLDAAQVDSLAARSGMTSATGSTGGIAKALGTIVFVLIIVPVAIAALGILDIRSISEPLGNMLSSFLDYIPVLIGASIVLAVSIFIGRFISNFIQQTLPTFGFDRSINEIMMLDDGEGLSVSPSKVAGNLAFIIVLVLGLSAAVGILNIQSLSGAFESVQNLGGRVLTAGITIVVGVFLANFVSRIIGGATASKVGSLLRYAVIILATFMALSQLGIGQDIVDFAFMAILGSAAVAAAIAFGIGGRDWASKKLHEMFPPKTGIRKK